MTNQFTNYNLSASLLKALNLLEYKEATEVQSKVIPLALKGHDLVVQSKTGSGKTAAFAIPICDRVEWEENRPQALVLVPTRELALQVKEVCFTIGRFKRIKVVGAYGKAPFEKQRKELKQKTHIVVATPGRLIDHLEQGTINLEAIKYLVIDEADEMLRMGFIEQIKAIIRYLPSKRTTFLFSATYKDEIEHLIREILNHPINIQIAPKESAVPQIDSFIVSSDNATKMTMLEALIYKEQPECSMIFCNRRNTVDEVYSYLARKGFSVAKLHGGMEQRDRFKVIQDFKLGRSRYVVCTDVAARGIDIDEVTHVFNFDVPEDEENYVHRIGRTGRMGRVGKAITLVSSYENELIAQIERYIQRKIPIKAFDFTSLLENEEENAKIRIRHVDPDAKTKKLDVGIMKLHINAGKKTKMRAVDIVGTLCHLEGVVAEDIGIIDIQDISTFVEILNGKGDYVHNLLQHTPIKGRLRKVSKKES